MTSADRSTRFLYQPLGTPSRLLLVAAAVLTLAAYFYPLWNLTMFAPQYRHGLTLDIYQHELVGGNKGQDIKEINLLNHYIGMRDLATEDFTEFQWMPFALGVVGLLFLRASVFGTIKEVVDATVLLGYVGVFSFWSFGYRLYRYGHDLSPTAAVKVEPFTPPIFGYQKIANFEVYSYPRTGTYILLAAGLAVAAVFVLAWRARARARRAS
jgi:hypothetical protein